MNFWIALVISFIIVVFVRKFAFRATNPAELIIDCIVVAFLTFLFWNCHGDRVPSHNSYAPLSSDVNQPRQPAPENPTNREDQFLLKKTISDRVSSKKSDYVEFFNSFCGTVNNGISYTKTPSGLGAVFNRESQSRIEYPFKGFPKQGTLEWKIFVNHGYKYSNHRLINFCSDALLFTTVGPDTWYPGCIWLTVEDNGIVSFSMSDSFGGASPVRKLSAKKTSFRFGEWHSIGISYGSQGRSICVDGSIVAQDALSLPLGIGGTLDHPCDKPTIGEMKSQCWSDDQHDSGFDGVVDTFRISLKQNDWKLR